MTDHRHPAEPRPRDFTARLSRDPAPIGRRRRNRHAGRRLAVLAAAIAVPAMAAPVEWQPAAPRASAPARPLGFEIPGESFPGSAFYYLDDLPNVRGAAGSLPAEEAGIALPRPSAGGLDSGPIARALFSAGSLSDRARARRCLTLAIYYEAATEPDAGQRAVAQVVLNRVAHPAYPDTVCGVVFQGSERRTGCQFSFTCDGALARRPARMWWDRAERVADAALAGAVYAPVGLATHYHTVQIHPYWADSLDHIGTIGAHRFYRWRGAAGRPAAFSDAYLGGEPVAAPHARLARAEAGEADPLALARAYETALEAARATAAAAPAPHYSAEIEARGGDALFRAQPSSVSGPGAGQVREEYARSGQWLKQPGS
ncbi:MAG TPA: cell wall hydrolase [Croceibacterium sp.]|nr:cell wall hydrolase [Croceibacterium sp.]